MYSEENLSHVRGLEGSSFAGAPRPAVYFKHHAVASVLSLRRLPLASISSDDIPLPFNPLLLLLSCTPDMWPFSKKQNLDRRDSDMTHNDSEIKATTGIGPKALIFVHPVLALSSAPHNRLTILSSCQACGAALFSCVISSFVLLGPCVENGPSGVSD